MFGNNLRQLLKEKKISSRELATAMDVSETYISYLLNGKKRPSLSLLENISKHLGVTPTDLMAKKEPPPSERLEAIAKKHEAVLLALDSMDPELVAELSARIEAAASLFPRKDAPGRTGQGGASFSRKKKPG